MKFKAQSIKEGEYLLTGLSLEILYLIHKNKSINEIRKVINTDFENIKKALKLLIENDLIVQKAANNSFLDQGFYSFLQSNLAKAIGPMADLLIEDAFAEFEVNKNKVPKNQAASIVRMLSLEIKDQKTRHIFLKIMNSKLI